MEVCDEVERLRDAITDVLFLGPRWRTEPKDKYRPAFGEALAALDDLPEHIVVQLEAIDDSDWQNRVRLTLTGFDRCCKSGAEAGPDMHRLIEVRDKMLWAVRNENEPMSVTPTYVGNCKIKIGNQPPIVLTENEDCVIAAVVEAGGACDIHELRRKSGVDDAPRVFKGIARKHPDLAEHLFAPGGKSKGGYRTTIKPLST